MTTTGVHACHMQCHSSASKPSGVEKAGWPKGGPAPNTQTHKHTNTQAAPVVQDAHVDGLGAVCATACALAQQTDGTKQPRCPAHPWSRMHMSMASVLSFSKSLDAREHTRLRPMLPVKSTCAAGARGRGRRPGRLPGNCAALPPLPPCIQPGQQGPSSSSGPRSDHAPPVPALCPAGGSRCTTWCLQRASNDLREVTPQSGAAGAGAAPVPPPPSPPLTEGASPGCSCQSVLHWMAARPGGRRCRLLGRTAAVKGFGASARRSCIVATISVLAQTDQRCR